jgi:DNA-binding MarR family transcriptional regulator
MSAFYTPESYTVRGSIGYLIRRARNLMSARVEHEFDAKQITFVQWILLMQLRDGLASTAAELSRDMCHDSGALTRVIDNLEQRGLIERRRAVTDRRVVELKLTDAGIAMVNSLVPTVVGLLNASLAGFSDDEARDFTRLLNKFVDNVAAANVAAGNVAAGNVAAGNVAAENMADAKELELLA